MVDGYSLNRFPDVFRQITDPLQIICNSKDAQNFSQVDSDRLAFCDGLDNLFINRSLHFINRGIGCHHLAGGSRFRWSSFDGIANLTLDTSPHLRKRLRQGQ